MFTKRNLTRPFEDQSSVEFLCKVNDSSLFTFGSHTKKRPQNFTMGRTFDFQV
jgi:ribosome production factor 2